jgi:hypothetical protein
MEKSALQLLQKIYSIRQARKETVAEYVGQLRMLYNRLDAQSQPTAIMLVNWFIAGLRKEF